MRAIAGSHGKYTCSFVRNHQLSCEVIVLFAFHQQWMKVPVAPYSCQYVMLSVVWPKMDFGHFNRCVIIFHCCFNMHFLD